MFTVSGAKPRSESTQGRAELVKSQPAGRTRRPHTTATCAVVALAFGALVTGCSSSSAPPATSATDTSNNVQFTACQPTTCSGALDGNPYEIVMPAKWNGSLLIYSQDTPALSPTAVKYKPVAEVAPGWATQNHAISDLLLAQGYALAGAATQAAGWQVSQQVEAAIKLREHFASAVGTPNRIYTWGESTGALASVVLAQQNDWVNGSAPLCGLLAGINPNYDLALDAAFAVKTLLAPGLKLSDYKSAAEANDAYKTAMAAVAAAAKDKYGQGGVKLNVIAAAAVVPMKTAINSGSGMSGSTVTVPENLMPILARSTVGRYQVEQQFHGNPSTNVGTDYAARVTPAQTAKLDIYSKGAMAKYLAVLAKAKRVAANATARDAAATSGAITGNVRVPTATLHTEYDATAIVQNDSAYAAAAIKAGTDQSRLLKVNITSPPTSYPEKGAVPYGAGHCNFTPQSVVGTLAVVNDQVRDGIYPTAANTTRLMGPESGLNPTFRLQPWPPGPTA